MCVESGLCKYICMYRCPRELGLNSNSRLKVHEIEEGTEPEEFWVALSKHDRKAYDCMLEGTKNCCGYIFMHNISQ